MNNQTMFDGPSRKPPQRGAFVKWFPISRAATTTAQHFAGLSSVDQAAVEKVRSAPTACPYCGGAITTQIVRGMDSIKCEFCGKLIRI